MAEPEPQARDQTIRLVRVGLALAIGYLLYLTFLPFLSAIAWAAILSYALYPLYRRLLRATRERRTLSAALMSLLVTLALFLPILYLSFLIGEELADTYKRVVAVVQSEDGFFKERWKEYPIVATVVDQVQAYERQTGTDLRAVLADNLTALGKTLVGQLTQVATDVLRGLVELAFILLCAFFFFRDGDGLVAWLQQALPISLERQHIVLQRFDEVVVGAIYGNFLVAALEGLVGGLAFWALGLPSPILWGAVMGILGYLPMAGAGIVLAPAILSLVVTGAYVKVTALSLVWVLIIYLDNIVRNKLVADRVQLHPLLVFFGVLGGIQVFGLLGIVAGPLLVAMGRTILDLYWLEKVALTTDTAEPSSPVGRSSR